MSTTSISKVHNDRTVVFVDGANLFNSARFLNFDIDFKLFKKVLENEFNVIRINYYTALYKDENDHIKIQKIVDWLAYNGYNVITKPAKIYRKDDGTERIKGNMDVEMTVHALECTEYANHVILCTGDGDFKELVLALQRKGIVVTIISTTRTNPPMVADELRKQADNFIDISDWEERVLRNLPRDNNE